MEADAGLKVLVTGRGTGGSWKIRGEQLGEAIGAKVRVNALTDQGFDLTVVVKRCPDALRAYLKGLVVWDVVDAYPQPEGNLWSREKALKWLRREVERIRPAAIVAATETMADDCAIFGLPVACVPHHARPEQPVNPIRPEVRTVGYEGAADYLGRWRDVIEAECHRRGWTFVVNPPALADVDIVVALREADGYPARHWKSNVKLANAQATGTPCILGPERGYLETQSGAECWAEDHRSLAASLDRLADHRYRLDASRVLQSATPHLSSVASRYATWLAQLRS